jgi:hypothetical protein
MQITQSEHQFEQLENLDRTLNSQQLYPENYISDQREMLNKQKFLMAAGSQ